MISTKQHPVRLLLTLAAVSCLGFACATVDNDAIAAQKTAGKAVPVANNAPVYYWYDGNKKREIVIASDKVADFSKSAVIVDAAVATKSSTGATNTSEVFVDAKSGRMSRWLVQSEPGMASLDLANALYESGQFQSASPNWFKQRATK